MNSGPDDPSRQCFRCGNQCPGFAPHFWRNERFANVSAACQKLVSSGINIETDACLSCVFKATFMVYSSWLSCSAVAPKRHLFGWNSSSTQLHAGNGVSQVLSGQIDACWHACMNEATDGARGYSSGYPRNPISNCSESAEIENLFFCDRDDCIYTNMTCDGINDCSNGRDETFEQCGCLDNEFECSLSKDCIALARRCDKVPNCKFGEDEENCGTFQCSKIQFKCANHYCIPKEYVCDFKDDCGDGSDEVNCNYRNCWFSEFMCDNRECLRPAMVCNGVPDCLDSSDEDGCLSDFCENGRRIHNRIRCDGWPDCSNHADELHCECNTTSGNYFTCPNTRCVRKSKLCDGICDCLGEDPCFDEKECEDYYTYVNGYRMCKVGATIPCKSTYKGAIVERCISPEFICDGENDCHNGYGNISDEYGCTPEEDEGGGIGGESEFFQCGEPDRRKLHVMHRCDFHVDCLNGEDEEDCDSGTCRENEFQCSNGECIPQELRCDAIPHCHDKSDEGDCLNFKCPLVRNGSSFIPFRQCNNGQCIEEDLWCDYIRDCSDGSDEQFCGPARPCREDEFPCKSLNQCIPLSRRCHNDGNPRSGCADGSHLLDCNNFTCPDDTFKCTMGSCLDRSLVCDGKIDCFESWIDEENCTYNCFSVCSCIDTTANCTGLGLTSIHKLEVMEDPIRNFYLANNNLSRELNANFTFHLRFALVLDLSNNSICSLTPGIFRDMQALKTFILQNNCLTVLHSRTFDGLANLNGLHLEGNRIQRLDDRAFYGLSSLPTLNLRNQELAVVSKGAFRGLRKLTSLDLSHNNLQYLSDGTFHDLTRLAYLDLRKNPLRSMGSQIFASMGTSLQVLLFDSYKFCCLAKNVPKCEPTTDEFSSCEDLMSNFVLRICIWVLGTIATLGNLLVIAWRMKFKHTNRVHSFLITNLAIGDLLMGFYLILIAITDAHYRGVYSIHDEEWRNSQWCSLAGFLSTLSSELSVLTLTVITLDRFLVIIFPFKLSRLEMKQTRWVMLAVWIIALVLSGLPLFYREYFKNFYGRSAVCLALHLTKEKRDGWKYSVFVFVFLNLMSFSVIAIGYLWMYGVARTTRLAVGRQTETKTAEAAMARRMTLIVATDAACWIPIIFLGILSLCGVTVPSQAFAWVAVFVLPLNAAINPILYTISTTSFLDPATRNLKRFNRSCKLSLSNDQRSRRTYSSNWGSSFSNNSRFDTYLHYLKQDRNELELIKLGDQTTNSFRKHTAVMLNTHSIRTKKSKHMSEKKETEDSGLESIILTDATSRYTSTSEALVTNESGKCSENNRLIIFEPQPNHWERRKSKRRDERDGKSSQRRSEKKKRKIDRGLYD